MNQTKSDELNKKHYEWILQGIKTGKIFTFPDELFDYLRPYSFGGLPVSILMLISEMNNGYCFDRAKLMQLAFDDCKVIYADIESLRILEGEKYSEHAYIECNCFDDRKTTYVVDTSLGLIFEKEYFDEFEKPKVNHILTKEECMNSKEVKEVLASDFEKDKWALVLTLPLIEDGIENSNNIGTVIYREKLQEEIAKLKEAINFDAMQTEVEEDIKLMGTNPDALDKKFKIVRDRYGAEISRGGVKNPYYRKTRKRDLAVLGASDDNSKINLDKICKVAIVKSIRQHNREVKKTEKQAKIRLKKIQKNPTQDVYRQPGTE